MAEVLLHFLHPFLATSIKLSIDAKDGTLTGTIEFDRFGHRKNYDVSVIDLVSNTKATFNSKEVLAC